MPDQQVRGLVDLLESLGYGTAADIVRDRNRGAVTVPDEPNDERAQMLRRYWPELFDERRPILRIERSFRA